MHKRGYEKISISIPQDTMAKLNKLAEYDEFSRSEIISKLVEFGLDNITEVSDLEPLRIKIDWPERNRVHDIELRLGDEITMRTPTAAFKILPWEEGDRVDIVPLRGNRAFERVSLWNTVEHEDSRYGVYVGSATLVCIGLGLTHIQNNTVKDLYDPESTQKKQRPP